MGKLCNIFETVNANTCTTNCPLCGRTVKIINLPARKNYMELDCPNCGVYVVQPEFLNEFDDAEHAFLLSGYLRHEYRQPMTVTNLSVEFAKQIIKLYLDKTGTVWSAANLIFHYEQKMRSLNDWCTFEDYPAIGYCKDSGDIKSVLAIAVDCGYMEVKNEMVRATALGMEFSEKMRRNNCGKEQRKIAELIMNGLRAKKQFQQENSGFPLSYVAGPRYNQWIAEVNIINTRLLKEHPLHDKISRICENQDAPDTYEDLMSQLNAIEADIEFWEERKKETESVMNNKVFIVHGRNQIIRNEVELKLRRVGLEPVILAETASRGMTIIEKIEANSDVAYAVVLYTACDIGKYKDDNTVKELLPRARQNVVFEHGYMVAKLGRSNVVALVEDGVEEPGDLDGVVYISMNDAEWTMKLVKELRAAGLPVKD